MTDGMEAALYALIGAIILWILQTIWKNFVDMRVADGDRRNLGRRVDDLEKDVKSLKAVFITMTEMKKDIEHILESVKKFDGSLIQLHTWQTTYQHVVERAERFIEEAQKDGVWTKERGK